MFAHRILSFLLLICVSFGQAAEIPAIRVEGSLPVENPEEKPTWQVTVVAGEKQEDTDAIIDELAKDRKENPSVPITVVAVGEGEPAVEQVNAAAKEEDLGSTPEIFGVKTGGVKAPPLAALAAKTAKNFNGAKLFWINTIRPKLPISPETAQDTRPDAVRMTLLKGFIGGAAAGSVLFYFKENIHYTADYILNGMALTSYQAAIALATGYRNNEVNAWFADEGLLRATGVKDTGKFKALKANAKLFGIMSVVIAASTFQAGMLGLKSTLVDPMGTATSAFITTAVGKKWYDTIKDHLAPDSPWRNRIPVFVFGVASIGNVAAALNGPLNWISGISWGSLAAGGYVTHYALKNREKIAKFLDVVGQGKVARGLANACGAVLSRIRGK